MWQSKVLIPVLYVEFTMFAMEDIEIVFTRNRLRWLGRVSRMESNERPVKELLYVVLDKAKPELRSKVKIRRTR